MNQCRRSKIGDEFLISEDSTYIEAKELLAINIKPGKYVFYASTPWSKEDIWKK